MTKVLTFKIEIEELESKIWRKLEITDHRTVADLAYSILSTFKSLSYHLYHITYKNNVYDSWVAIDHDFSDIPKINATITPLSKLELKENDTLIMDYDFGSTTTFKITYLGSSEFKRGTGRRYPRVIDGAGSGMIDDRTPEELRDIIDEIDRKKVSDVVVLNIFGLQEIYDYRKFDLIKNNLYIKRTFYKIKYGYEMEE